MMLEPLLCIPHEMCTLSVLIYQDLAKFLNYSKFCCNIISNQHVPSTGVISTLVILISCVYKD